jgi:hypothetical protein
MDQRPKGGMEWWSKGVSEGCAFSGWHPASGAGEVLFLRRPFSRNYGGQAGRLPWALPLGCSCALFLDETNAKLSQRYVRL